MAGIIEVDARGGPAARFVERAVCGLREEYVKAGIKIRSLVLDSVPPVPQVVVGIITPVPPPLIVRLIDTILKAKADVQKEFPNTDVNVFITHQEGRRRFSLPGEREKCEAYFASLPS
jgi:hypothetical protein